MTIPEYDTKFGLLIRRDSPLGLVPQTSRSNVQNATKGEKEESSTLSNFKTYQRIVSLCQMPSQSLLRFFLTRCSKY